MSAHMQDALVIIIIAMCAGALAWRAIRTLRGKRTGCGCDRCPALKKPSPPPRR